MESLHYLFMKTHTVFSRSIMSKASSMGLTSGQPKILECLWKLRESDQKGIAAYCEIEQATVGSILLRMEKAGLVLRRQHEGNRRSLYVSLTEKGEAAAEQLMDVFNEIDALAESVLSTGEVTRLKIMLKKINAAVSDVSEEGENRHA